MMKYATLIAFIMLVTVVLLLKPQQVHACSYGELPGFEEIISGSSTVVRGRIIESDTARQNFILQVENYLSEPVGPEFLLISQNRPAAIQGMIDSQLGNGDCYWFERPLPEHEVGYFFIGAPSPLGVYSYSFFDIMIWESGFPLDFYDAEGNVTETYDQAGFEEYLLDLRGTRLSEPLPNSRYPATAPLLVTTENGNEYILPVSANSLVPFDEKLWEFYSPPYIGEEAVENSCKDWDCITWSSDGRTLIVETRDNYAYVQTYRDFRFQADSFLLSPIGLAVWQDNTIRVYALHDQVRGASTRTDLLREIATTPIESHLTSNANHSVWSPDGRLLAFSDRRGLWLWDVFTPNAAPTLIVSSDTVVPYANAFSQYGRYLSIQKGEERFILDVLTDNRLPSGYISPDEMLMIRCVPQNEGVCQLKLDQLAPYATIPSWDCWSKTIFVSSGLMKAACYCRFA
jgi:hypothetical protein